MIFERELTLKNGKKLLMRNGLPEEGGELLRVFNATHTETDFLLTYPEENTFTEEQESRFLKEKYENDKEIEIVAFVDGKIVGSAGFEAIGSKFKVKHRCDFGISILKDYWGMGIGKALTQACIDCAQTAGYSQIELEAVAQNSRAISMYESLGFVEFGRNPRGFRSRLSGFQEVVHMYREL